MTKRCPDCKVVKPLAAFREHRPGKRFTYCVPCASFRAAAYAARKKFGITREQYGELKKISECMVCGESRPDGRTLDIDHCHKSKRIRGMLCRRCNNALGMVRDNPDTLRNLALYLENSREGLPTLYE